MRIHVTLPTNMALRDWADQVVLDMDKYGAIGKLMDESKWQDWAMQIFNNTSLKNNFPIPYQFNNWKDWAERFCQVLA